MCPPQSERQAPPTPSSASEDSPQPEHFNCSICLELVYKPIVQACGHIFCFWCTYQAMNVQKESHCPICRRPYMYFPRVCELLHFALGKALPKEYQRRGQDIQRMEEQREVYSPQLELKHTWSPRPVEGSCMQNVISTPTPRGGSDCFSSSNTVRESLLIPEGVNKEAPSLSEESMDCNSRDISSAQSSLTVDDFSCLLCHRLVCHPVVLNCGEVFCASCLKMSKSAGLQCPSCANIHPQGLVRICVELHAYLEFLFPVEYAKRKEETILQNAIVTIQLDDRDVNNSDASLEGHLHEGVGCDGCGLYPIKGSRYQCKDCKDKIGFDLCGACYTKGGDFLGRFNQHHKSSHQMVELNGRCIPFNMQNGSIQQRRRNREQQRREQLAIRDDFDEYINSFVG